MQKVAPDAALACLESVVIERDFSKDLGVLLAQRAPAASEIIEHVGELLRAQIAVWMGAPNQLQRLIAGPSRRAAHRDKMLREDVEGRVRHANFVEMAAAGEEHGGAGLDEVADVGRHEHAAAHGVDIMSGATGALEGFAHAFRRREHDDEIDGADVDSELEAGRADDSAQLAAL